ncbi:hypothetical protein V6Z11_D09G131300 [Gossypium hirsutum]
MLKTWYVEVISIPYFLADLLVEIIGCNDFLESFYLIYFPFIFLNELIMYVFSAFGFVHKITTFEKTVGLQGYIY